MPAATRDQSETRVRPRSVVILIVLQVIQSLGLIGYSLYLVSFGGWRNANDPAHIISYLPFVFFSEATSAIMFMVLGILTFIITISLYMLRRWAWVAAMAIQGLGLLAAVFVYLRGSPNFVGMALGIIIVLYLNQQEVEQFYHQERSRSV